MNTECLGNVAEGLGKEDVMMMMMSTKGCGCLEGHHRMHVGGKGRHSML